MGWPRLAWHYRYVMMYLSTLEDVQYLAGRGRSSFVQSV